MLLSRIICGSVVSYSRRGFCSIKELLNQTPERLAILYGTHSGNSQKHARYLHSELASRFGVSVPLKNLEDVKWDGIEQLTDQDTLIFLISTYGEGEPNAATQGFWDCVRQSSQEAQPWSFSFSILSRGSSLFDQTFAHAGIKLQGMLTRLGATPLTPVCVQDKVSHQEYDEYFRWKEILLSGLKAHKGLLDKPYEYTPSTEVVEIARSPTLTPQPVYHRLSQHAAMTRVKAQFIQKATRQYVHAEVNLPGYKTGDYVCLWPTNPQEKSNLFLEAVFGTNNERRQNLLRLSDGTITSYEQIARTLVDVNGIPDRECLFKLAHMAPSPSVSRALNYMVTSEDTQVPALADLLHAYGPWCESLPPSSFFDVLPQLEPRRYSIASSDLQFPEWAGLSCVVEQDVLSNFTGVATGELADIARTGEKTMMACWEPVPSFRLPSDPTVPLICFGVGTGVAPFRGFIQERVAQSRQSSVGPIALFTGTRTSEDLIHSEEIERWSQSKTLDLKVISAFSRVAETHPQKGYLVDKIPEHEQLIWELFEQGAHIYICGDVKKVRSNIRKQLMSLLVRRLGLPPDQRKPLWKKLTKEGRTHQELW